MIVYMLLFSLVAFFVGVAVGIRYMHDKYNQQMLDNTTPLRVAYICDRKFCDECDNPDCHHCFDITHARNFECIADNEYWEKEDTGDHG